MLWTEPPLQVLDFEGGAACGILEYGVATLAGGGIRSVESGLCAPQGRIRPEDTRLHGLDAANLSGRPPFRSQWERFQALRRSGLLAAHFAGAERHLLGAVWPYPGACPDFLRPGRTVAEWGPWIDTARLLRAWRPDWAAAGLDLATCIRSAGLQEELDRAAACCPPDRRRYHAAGYDALAAALLLLRLCQLRPTPPTLAELVEAACDPAAREQSRQPELF